MKGITLKAKKIELEERENLKDERAWQKLEELGRKISKAWKSEKTALELIKEGRR